MERKCEYCQSVFKTAYSLKRHINKKKPCFMDDIEELGTDVYTQDEIEKFSEKDIKKGYYEKDGIYFCILCNYSAKTQNNLPKHCKKHCSELVKRIKESIEIKNAVKKKYETEEAKKENENMQEQINDLKTKLETYKKTRQNIIVQNIYAGNTNIPIRPLGQEDLSFVTAKLYRKAIANPPKTLGYLTKLINFNENRVENWNIHKSEEDYIIYLNENNEWKVKHKNDFAQYLTSIREDQSYSLEKRFNGLKEFVEKYNKKVDKMGEDYSKLSLKDILKEVEEGTNNNDIFINQNRSDVIEKLRLSCVMDEE